MAGLFGEFYFPGRYFDRVQKLDVITVEPSEIVAPKGCYRFQLFRETETGAGTWPNAGSIPTREPLTGFCYVGGRTVKQQDIKDEQERLEQMNGQVTLEQTRRLLVGQQVNLSGILKIMEAERLDLAVEAGNNRLYALLQQDIVL